MKLSEHFTLSEFTRSNKAASLGLDNTPTPEALQHLQRTAQMLERVRAHLGGKPVSISSGYRSRAVNAAVGGKHNSDHMMGMAADIRVPGYGTPYEVAKALAPALAVLGIGQVIYEIDGDARWVHVSTRVPEKAINRLITVHGRNTLAGVQKV